jgi:hypothetical protein
MSLTLDDLDIYALVLKVCMRYQVDIQYDDFFNSLLAHYSGSDDKAALAAWLDGEIAALFTAFDKRPHWIQEPAWAFTVEGQPMVFIGQLDIKVPDGEGEIFKYHDDTSLYVFISKDGSETTVVKQQY